MDIVRLVPQLETDTSGSVGSGGGTDGGDVERWITHLGEGETDHAWDAFVERYRRLVFATIRRYAQDYDDVMDVFTHVCEALRDNDLSKLRRYTETQGHREGYHAWVVTTSDCRQLQ